MVGSTFVRRSSNRLRDNHVVAARAIYARAVLCVTTSLAIASCGGGGERISLVELKKEVHALCPGPLVIVGDHSIECDGDPKPLVGQRLSRYEQLSVELRARIAEQCKTAPPAEKRKLLCAGTVPIGG